MTNKFARVTRNEDRNEVAEVFVAESGTIGDYFHSGIADLFEPCPDGVQARWTKNDDGSWSPPEEV